MHRLNHSLAWFQRQVLHFARGFVMQGERPETDLIFAQLGRLAVGQRGPGAGDFVALIKRRRNFFRATFRSGTFTESNGERAHEDLSCTRTRSHLQKVLRIVAQSCFSTVQSLDEVSLENRTKSLCLIGFPRFSWF